MAKAASVLAVNSTDVTRLDAATTAIVAVPAKETGVRLVMNLPKTAPLLSKKAKPNRKSSTTPTKLPLNKPKLSRLKRKRLLLLNGRLRKPR